MSYFFHGSQIKNLQLTKHTRSRYGFSGIFFTSNKGLAELYKGKHGYIYQIDAITPDIVIDYEYKSSYSIEFKNLMFRLYKQNYRSVLIQNIIDYPTIEQKILEANDILIVYDIDLIKGLKLVLF